MKNAQFYMQHAIDLAELTIGQTRPNPSVGAVIVNNGVVVGTGSHLRAGQPHAEVHALRQAEGQTIGAEMYVTLEPCSHYGQTPPCAKAVAESGITKVYIATLDPNPKVAGNGVKWLKDEGIEVEVGLLEEQAKEINKAFFYFMKNKKPFVTLKTAVSLDGKMTANSGDSKWITSEAAREDVHTNRHMHEAILVGIETVLRDDPQLTTRLPHGGLNPIRFVLDTQLSIPLESNLLVNDEANTIVVCGNEASQEKEEVLQAIPHVSVWRLSENRIQLTRLLEKMKEANLMSVYVEGGSSIHSTFIQEGLFNQIHMYMAAKLIGGLDSKSFYNQLGFDQVKDAIQVKYSNVELVGPDLKITVVPLTEGED
ncbi:bifunctional diaminohydroxyphosphoribosylaminopyrimidine deaminase/5-amino-6-(5-phosphoribosylamino)uracil reductase RibD [Halalkalibacillus halophilus]|uniref:bifunctional diaminohydroxyphosphoribosylaminopyrimidine deaminase/5-amino-6-(5-phosphoribosylamino)uracil reductase RibD n=1 Tax=Halalkalibacillus halophilus TaxID=392827 RepID=UPI00041E44D4|nr:bifunctional diaminohydroxyphosphoribosylaminopyrimidine deaminase/5-amino-6-(5-phosphoribosylamino)uracil reductase RibD [Halalkalibacillus halophilus]